MLALPEEEWNRPYSRAQAVYPDRRLRKSKFWPAVGRVDEVYGERNVSRAHAVSCGGID